MPTELRRAFLAISGVVVVAALIWASIFESLPPADFSLQNESDVKTLDPARAEGSVEGRLLGTIFEGLLRSLPDGPVDPETGLQPMSPQPGMAESFTVSDDGTEYVFKMREDAKWSDGSPVTSHDFAYSWQRVLHPEVLSQYYYHLHHLPYAQAYNEATVEVGDRVEVELFDRVGPDGVQESPDGESNGQPYPRGTIEYGVVEKIDKETEPTFAEKLPEDPGDAKTEQERRDGITSDWKERWVYHVRLTPEDASGNVNWDADGPVKTYSVSTESPLLTASTQRCHWVLVALGKLKVMETPDDRTFIVHLRNRVPYFANVVAFYTLFPVNKQCVEAHGAPLWTKTENIVTNGPYKVAFRRLRERVRVVKNEHYYGVDDVALETVDFMSVEKSTTAMNMYETGQIQWVTDPPVTLLNVLRKREDYRGAPYLSVYFYRFNVNEAPMNDVRVRRAIAMAINRKQIVEKVTRGGQTPAFTIVPPGLAGYKSAVPFEYDIDEAKRLLADAGYPGGRGMPKITVLYNTSEQHRDVAEVVQQQLRNTLNIPIALENMEWGTYLDKVSKEDYQIARAGWIADYPDPNTFLDMWITGGPQNNTGWSNPDYDRLIEDAGKESDPTKRFEMLRRAEQYLIDEMPVIPFYFYVSPNMVKTNILGFGATAEDRHPIHLLKYKDE